MNISDHVGVVASLDLRYRRYAAACDTVASLPFLDRIALTQLQKIAQRLLSNMRSENKDIKEYDTQGISREDQIFLTAAFSELLTRIGNLRADICCRRPYILPVVSVLPPIAVQSGSSSLGQK